MKHADFKTLMNHGGGAGGGVDPFVDYTLMLDFTRQVYWANGVKAASLSAMPGYSYTRTGQVQVVDEDNTIDTFAANVPAINANGYHCSKAMTNLLLNAGQNTDLVTQNVTVTSVVHTLSFIGTGTVTMSGAFAGVIVGEGADKQTKYTFTPIDGTLTLTVTGTVRFASLALTNYATVPLPIIATAGATAAKGADRLDVGTSLPAGDFIAFVEVRSALPSLNNTHMYDVSANTWQEHLMLKFGQPAGEYYSVAAAKNYNANFLGTPSGSNFMFWRKVAGVFRAGWLGGDDVVTYNPADTIAPNPINVSKCSIGSDYAGTNGIGGRILAAGIKPGTFDTPAKIIALRNEINVQRAAPLPTPIAVLDFKNDIFSINGVTKTKAQMYIDASAYPGWGSYGYSLMAIIPSAGIYLTTSTTDKLVGFVCTPELFAAVNPLGGFSLMLEYIQNSTGNIVTSVVHEVSDTAHAWDFYSIFDGGPANINKQYTDVEDWVDYGTSQAQNAGLHRSLISNSLAGLAASTDGRPIVQRVPVEVVTASGTVMSLSLGLNAPPTGVTGNSEITFIKATFYPHIPFDQLPRLSL